LGNLAYGGGEKETITIDLVNFNQVCVDKTNWQATIGAGLQVGEISKQLLHNGNRAVAHGTCPSVGIGGHATIGGLGPASVRIHDLSVV
jgi:FAD/FMN-containing dehydrogenase